MTAPLGITTDFGVSDDRRESGLGGTMFAALATNEVDQTVRWTVRHVRL